MNVYQCNTCKQWGNSSKGIVHKDRCQRPSARLHVVDTATPIGEIAPDIVHHCGGDLSVYAFDAYSTSVMFEVFKCLKCGESDIGIPSDYDKIRDRT